MKIAFVGKGGSGKSTLASLFIRYLQQQDHLNILAIDADLNMNLAGLLGARVADGNFLSRPEIADDLRRHLKGTNPRIKDVSMFLPTTPPGSGSNLIEHASDPALKPYAVRISEQPLINLLTVGTYEADGVGQSCYHVNLFVAENLLSHTKTNEEFHVVCDMVAGTDAFAYSLHLQFDAINLIAEPTPESMEVCKLYLNLAREAGVDELVHVIANKIEDEQDLAFVRKHLGKEPIAMVPVMSELKKARQSGQMLTEALLTAPIQKAMQEVERRAQKPAIHAEDRLEMLHKLHKKLNGKKWVQLSYGDVQDQLDPEFKLQEATGVLV